jgi:geranylgeranyl reductase family protein
VNDFDLIVVGAGPGGSNAASVALDAGLRVVQIDSARFPRVKPCAGGVTLKAAAALRFALDPSVCRSFDAIEFNLWGKRRNRFRHPGVVLRTVCRPEFDNRLVRENLSRRNFTFLDGARVTAVDYDGRFTVKTSAGRVTGAQLIGADGAYSIVNRIFRIAAPRAMATAIEVNIPHAGRETMPNDVPCLDYGAVKQGYGWVFPKDDHWSVGLYTLSARTSNIREQLSTYIRSKGLPDDDFLDGLQAFRIPVGGFRLKTPDCPVYVVGDAGGFADALTGEGIYYALESGRLAGETAAGVAHGRSRHATYYRRLWRSVLCDTAISYALSKPFFRDVERGMAVLESPFVWRPLIEGTARGATLAGSVLKSAGYLVRSWSHPSDAAPQTIGGSARSVTLCDNA